MSSAGVYIDVMTGNVGIGTKTVLYPFHIDGNIQFQDNFLISNNVGIGTTIAKTNLDIVGTLKASNFIGDFAGNINATSASTVSLTTTRTIAGISYNGTQNISFSSLTPGSYINSSAYDFSTARSWSISNVFTSNIANSIIARDGNGDFSTDMIYVQGNIGVGTTIARQRLHITSNLNIGSNVKVYVNNILGTTNQYIYTDGTIINWSTLSGVSSSNILITSGSNQTLTISSNVKYMVVSMWGGGGGGGGGITNTTCSGGAGGSSGQFLRFTIPNIRSPASNMSLTYTIGSGGSAGSSGNAGGNGEQSYILLGNDICAFASGGNGGGAGQASAASTGGTAVTAITNTFLYNKYGDSLAGAGGTSGAAGTNGTTASVSWGPGSGASGGGVASGIAYNGGIGGYAIIFGGTVAGGTAGTGTASGTGTAGGNGTSYTSGSLIVSASGGGGGGNGTTGGGNGGTGGIPGGGGGGGGSTSSGTAGSGGQGGSGMIIIQYY